MRRKNVKRETFNLLDLTNTATPKFAIFVYKNETLRQRMQLLLVLYN